MHTRFCCRNWNGSRRAARARLESRRWQSLLQPVLKKWGVIFYLKATAKAERCVLLQDCSALVKEFFKLVLDILSTLGFFRLRCLRTIERLVRKELGWAWSVQKRRSLSCLNRSSWPEVRRKYVSRHHKWRWEIICTMVQPERCAQMKSAPQHLSCLCSAEARLLNKHPLFLHLEKWTNISVTTESRFITHSRTQDTSTPSTKAVKGNASM